MVEFSGQPLRHEEFEALTAISVKGKIVPSGGAHNSGPQRASGLRVDRAIALVRSAAPCWATVTGLILRTLGLLPLAWPFMVKPGIGK